MSIPQDESKFIVAFNEQEGTWLASNWLTITEEERNILKQQIFAGVSQIREEYGL